MLPEQQQRIMGYFIEEAKDHLNTIEQGLLSLQATVEDSEKANEVFRAAHSVKGGAAMLGLESIQKIAHRMEDYFKVLKESSIQVDRVLETLFLRISDGLKDLLEQLEGPFGLTPDKAQEIMADVEPVFAQLESHLNSLVEHTDSAIPRASGVVSANGAAVYGFSPDALQASFKRDVTLLLRQMLTTFKQPDTADTRETIQSVCAQMKVIGKQFELSAWCDLLETARIAAAQLENDYRALAPILIREIKTAQNLVLSGRDSEVAVCEAMQALLPKDLLNTDLAGADSASVLDERSSFEDSFKDSLENNFEGISAALDEVDHAEVPDGLEDLFLENALPLDAPSNTGDLEGSDDFGNLFEAAVFESASKNLENNIDDSIDDSNRSNELDSDDIGRLSLDFDEIPLELSTLNRYRDSEEEADESLDALLATVNVTGPDVGTEELNSLADLFDGDLDELDNTLGGHAFISEEMRLNPEKIDLAEADDLTDLLANEDLEEEPLDAIAPDSDIEDDLFGGTLTEGEFATEADLDANLTDDNTPDNSISGDMGLLSEDVWAETGETSEDNLSEDVWADPESDDDLFEVDSLFEAAENSANALQSELGFDELGVDHEGSSDLLNLDELNLDKSDLPSSALADPDSNELEIEIAVDSTLESLNLNEPESSLIKDEDASQSLFEQGLLKTDEQTSERTVEQTVEQVLTGDRPPYPSTVLSPAVPASPREVEIEFPTLTGVKLQAAEEDIDSFFLDSQTDQPFAQPDDTSAELALEDFEDERFAVSSNQKIADGSWGDLMTDEALPEISSEEFSEESDQDTLDLDLNAVSPADSESEPLLELLSDSETDDDSYSAAVEEGTLAMVKTPEASDIPIADDDLWGEFAVTSESSSANAFTDSLEDSSENSLAALFDETPALANESLEDDKELENNLEGNTSSLLIENSLQFEEDLDEDFRTETTSSDPLEIHQSSQADQVNRNDNLLNDLFESSLELPEENLEESIDEGSQSEEANLPIADSFIENDLVNNELASDKADDKADDGELNGNFNTDFDSDFNSGFDGDLAFDEIELDDLLDFTLQDSEAEDESDSQFTDSFAEQSVAQTIDPFSEPIDEKPPNQELIGQSSVPFIDSSAVLSPEVDEVERNESFSEFSELDGLLTEETSETTERNNLDDDGLKHGALNDEFDDLDLLLADDLLVIEEPLVGDAANDFDDAPTFTPAARGIEIVQNSPMSVSDEDFDDLEKLLEDGASESPASVRRVPQRSHRRSGSGGREQNMRVSVSHLDTLSNLVGELVVSRNTLERDQERLRQFLDNLLFQVQQLNDVGQRMRDLYERSLLESSLLSNRRAHASGGNRSAPAVVDHATGATFDALEMDKFTGFHTLSQEMIELIVRVRESSSDIGYTVESADQVTRQFRQITTQLQEGLNTARMVAFSQAADRLPRAVRDISLKCGKEARLIVEGQDTLIDKMIVESLYDPLTHLVNNAITHGIETPAARRAAGKPTEGSITVKAFYQGNQTVIYVADDGGGINTHFVKQKAIEKSLISKAEADSLSDIETYELLFHPGFSTRDQADDFAGRGVGMDVVRTSLAEIRGSVTIDSEIGKGTSFTIRLPLTLSISKALSCVSNQARIAFPMDGVEDMLDVPRDRILKDNQGQNCVRWRDKLLPFQPVTNLLKFNRTIGRGRVYGGSQDDDVLSIIVLRNANTFVALQVDQVIGEQEIVIKQLEGPVPKPLGIAGATVLGDGRVMPIADVLELIDIAMGRIRREPASLLWANAAAAIEEAPVKSDPTVLIVDDSITVRELLSMSFNKVGYRVEQARDGQEAWDKLRSGLPCDLVFCDIEMPRMDGLELLSRMQKDNHLNRIPIAMLTSRGADRHRQMAIDLGASGYFTKPYLEEALLDAAQRMLNGETLAKGRGG